MAIRRNQPVHPLRNFPRRVFPFFASYSSSANVACVASFTSILDSRKPAKRPLSQLQPRPRHLFRGSLEPFTAHHPQARHGYLIELKYVKRDSDEAKVDAALADAKAQLARYLTDET